MARLLLCIAWQGVGDHPFQVFGDIVWMGHRVGAVALPRLRFASDFGVGLIYWAGCHAVNSGRTLGMATAGVRLARSKRPNVKLHWPRLVVRYLVEFLSASAAQRWQWWIVLDLVFLLIYRGGQYMQDVIAGTAVLAAEAGGDAAQGDSALVEPLNGGDREAAAETEA